ncbi:MAG: hypothetical protein PHP82_03905 [Candidatus ainarchaeum sp.]|nr:hypothetical protein [Candidatus ainarchaeum sp.]
MVFFRKKEENVEIEQGKYNEQCSVCGKSPCDKKWGGQYFHKKCFRKIKKMGKGML